MYSKLSMLVVLFSITGCSIMAVKKHSPHYQSTRKLKILKTSFRIESVIPEKAQPIQSSGDVKLAYQDNRPLKSNIERVMESRGVQCRLTTFNMPSNMTVQTYLKETFEHELDAAEKLDASSGKTIKALVKKLEVDTSSASEGQWLLDIEYEIDGKKHFISTKSPFESAFTAQAACTNAANTFSDAIAENFVALMAQIN